jgi:hypothetical protein
LGEFLVAEYSFLEHSARLVHGNAESGLKRGPEKEFLGGFDLDELARDGPLQAAVRHDHDFCVDAASASLD